MRINSVSYYNREEQWGFDKIDFFNLTLLVGISGVGKTQILKSIVNIKKIAESESINGAEWSIRFSNDKNEYTWAGKFEVKKRALFTTIATISSKENPKICSEKLLLNGKIIASRNEQEIFFEGVKMPRLSSSESLISLFKEEEKVKPAYKAFKQIVLRDYTKNDNIISEVNYLFDLTKLRKKYTSIEAIKNSGYDTVTKLYLLLENQKKVFNTIKENFIDIFPQVEGINIVIVKRPYQEETLIIYLKESGVDKWIPQTRISSGMLRTFLHISEMYLLSKDTVILIDEFENSLGINCINVLTDDLIFQNSDLQFIATSHHPYIINKIPYNYWKIVTRKGGIIQVHDAKEFDLGESHHERFINLINLREYKQGIEIN